MHFSSIFDKSGRMAALTIQIFLLQQKNADTKQLSRIYVGKVLTCGNFFTYLRLNLLQSALYYTS